MNQPFFLMLCVASFLSTNATASTHFSNSDKLTWPLFASFSMGPVWGSGGKTQTLALSPEIEKRYVSTKPSNNLIDGEIFLGVHNHFKETFQSQLGVAFATVSNATLAGHVWEDADPRFDNYVYRYNLQHNHIAFKGKLLKTNHRLMPWGSASVGIAFNHSKHFTNEPLICEAIASPNFGSHTRTAFTYTLEAGLASNISEKWQLGLGYSFSDWGKSDLNKATGQTENNRLNLSHFYTQGMLFNLTYLF